MYEKNDKRRLYWLIHAFIEESMSASEFCDEFYYSYDLQIDKNVLSDLEKKVFLAIDSIASRYSEFQEDHVLYPNAYTTELELREVVMQSVAILSTEEARAM